MTIKKEINTIGVLTSGGDAPGMNPSSVSDIIERGGTIIRIVVYKD